MPTTIYSDQSQPIKWVVRQRTDVSLTLTVTLNSSAYDLSTYTFIAEFFEVGNSSAFLTLTQGSGITNGGAAGTLVLAITDTQLNISANQYFWRLKTTAPTDNVWFNGVFDVKGYISDVPSSSSATVALTIGGDALSVALTIAGADTLAQLGTTLQTAASDTPLDADTFNFYDAVDAILKKVSWTNIKATLKPYFDTLYQTLATVISSSTTADNDGVYTVTASATFTDPSPAEGKGFTVFVRNGTATVGGTAYATAGTVIRRIYHSGAWANYFIQVDGTYVAQINTAVALTDGAAITLTAIKHTLTTDEATVTFTDSYAGDFLLVEVTLNVTSTVWTFSTGTAKCSFNGTPTGTNNMTITGTVGNRVHLSRAKVGNNYTYIALNVL